MSKQSAGVIRALAEAKAKAAQAILRDDFEHACGVDFGSARGAAAFAAIKSTDPAVYATPGVSSQLSQPNKGPLDGILIVFPSHAGAGSSSSSSAHAGQVCTMVFGKTTFHGSSIPASPAGRFTLPAPEGLAPGRYLVSHAKIPLTRLGRGGKTVTTPQLQEMAVEARDEHGVKYIIVTKLAMQFFFAWFAEALHKYLQNKVETDNPELAESAKAKRVLELARRKTSICFSYPSINGGTENIAAFYIECADAGFRHYFGTHVPRHALCGIFESEAAMHGVRVPSGHGSIIADTGAGSFDISVVFNEGTDAQPRLCDVVDRTSKPVGSTSVHFDCEGYIRGQISAKGLSKSNSAAYDAIFGPGGSHEEQQEIIRECSALASELLSEWRRQVALEETSSQWPNPEEPTMAFQRRNRDAQGNLLDTVTHHTGPSRLIIMAKPSTTSARLNLVKLFPQLSEYSGTAVALAIDYTTIQGWYDRVFSVIIRHIGKTRKAVIAAKPPGMNTEAAWIGLFNIVVSGGLACWQSFINKLKAKFPNQVRIPANPLVAVINGCLEVARTGKNPVKRRRTGSHLVYEFDDFGSGHVLTRAGTEIGAEDCSWIPLNLDLDFKGNKELCCYMDFYRLPPERAVPAVTPQPVPRVGPLGCVEMTERAYRVSQASRAAAVQAFTKAGVRMTFSPQTGAGAGASSSAGAGSSSAAGGAVQELADAEDVPIPSNIAFETDEYIGGIDTFYKPSDGQADLVIFEGGPTLQLFLTFRSHNHVTPMYLSHTGETEHSGYSDGIDVSEELEKAVSAGAGAGAGASSAMATAGAGAGHSSSAGAGASSSHGAAAAGASSSAAPSSKLAGKKRKWSGR